MTKADIFDPDFVAEPYWWQAYQPTSGELVAVPKEARVAIVGSGYAGLAAALELARHGVDAVVLERGALGVGASTRNGGSVSGGVNIGKSFSGRAAQVDSERAQLLLASANGINIRPAHGERSSSPLDASARDERLAGRRSDQVQFVLYSKYVRSSRRQ